MSAPHITARNRANASKSTGPRSAEGKAVVAANARRHGVTARPDPESVATWLAIILDEPDITPADLLPQEDLSYCALALAEAETRLVIAYKALTDFEARGASLTGRDCPDLAKILGDIQTWGPQSGLKQRNMCNIARLIYRSELRRVDQIRLGGKRHELLKRYLAEAKSKRRKAFAAWLEIRQSVAAGA